MEKLQRLFEENTIQNIFYGRDNSELINASFLKKIKLPFNTIFSIRTFIEIKKLLKKEHPDICHVHNTMPLISPSLYHAIKSSSNIPIVQHLHNFRFFCVNGYLFNNGKIQEECLHGNYKCATKEGCYRNDAIAGSIYAFSLTLHKKIKTFSKIDHFIAISQFVKNKYIEYGIPENKISVLHNFVDCGKGEPTGLFENYLVYLGRLSKEKGVSTLLKALKMVDRNIILKIIGDGPDRLSLESYVRNNKLRNVEFTGHIPHEHAMRLISKAKAMICPSEWYEAFGNVIIEAYSFGVPVLGSDLGAINELIIENHTGMLFKHGSFIDLAEKLEKLYSMPNNEYSQMRKNAYQYALNNFNKIQYFKNLLDIYEKATIAKKDG